MGSGAHACIHALTFFSPSARHGGEWNKCRHLQPDFRLNTHNTSQNTPAYVQNIHFEKYTRDSWQRNVTGTLLASWHGNNTMNNWAKYTSQMEQRRWSHENLVLHGMSEPQASPCFVNQRRKILTTICGVCRSWNEVYSIQGLVIACAYVLLLLLLLLLLLHLSKSSIMRRVFAKYGS